MQKHESKHCPRCRTEFECKAGSINQCQCSAIRLSEGERAYVASKYDDCLCIHCLYRLREEYLLFTEKYVFTK